MPKSQKKYPKFTIVRIDHDEHNFEYQIRKNHKKVYAQSFFYDEQARDKMAKELADYFGIPVMGMKETY